MLIFTYDNWTRHEFEARAREIEYENNNCQFDASFLDQMLTPLIPAQIMIYDREKFSVALQYLTSAQTENEIVSWQTITTLLNLHCKFE